MDFAALLTSEIAGQPFWIWGSFFTFIIILLFLDLFVLNKKDHEIEFKESLRLSGFYIFLALLYGVFIYFFVEQGPERAALYYTVYFLEESLSMDNIFVMSVIFSYFAIPRMYQHRVLFWGIIGVIVFRFIMIGLGTAIIAQFEWLLFLFALLLIWTGYKIIAGQDSEFNVGDHWLYKFIMKNFNVTEKIHGNKFFIQEEQGGKLVRRMTPLFVALMIIEMADLIFALDSIPAALAITQDTYVIYTANIFAILGLRAMYFVLAALVHRFEYLKYALSLVLIFIGCKVFYSHFFGHIHPTLSLAITLGTLLCGLVFSLLKTKNSEKPE